MIRKGHSTSTRWLRVPCHSGQSLVAPKKTHTRIAPGLGRRSAERNGPLGKKSGGPAPDQAYRSRILPDRSPDGGAAADFGR
jgi:hypothetical protein